MNSKKKKSHLKIYELEQIEEQGQFQGLVQMVYSNVNRWWWRRRKGRKSSRRRSNAEEGEGQNIRLSNFTIFSIKENDPQIGKRRRKSMVKRNVNPRKASYMQMTHKFTFYSISPTWTSATWQLHLDTSKHLKSNRFLISPHPHVLTVPLLVFPTSVNEKPSFKQFRNIGIILNTSFTFHKTQFYRFVISGNCSLASISCHHPYPFSFTWNTTFVF